MNGARADAEDSVQAAFLRVWQSGTSCAGGCAAPCRACAATELTVEERRVLIEAAKRRAGQQGLPDL